MISNVQIEKQMDEHLANMEAYFNMLETELLKNDTVNIAKASAFYGKLVSEYKDVMYFRKAIKNPPTRTKKS